MIADTGDFGKVCVGSFADEPLILNNNGRCPLSVTGISSSSSDFLTPLALSYPVAIAPGAFLPAPIRFAPTSLGLKSATITVSSDDPSGPHAITVRGQAPAGKLTVTGSPIFGGVKCCHHEQRTLSICNTGECSLHVTHVGFKHKRRHFRILNNPFPATLWLGSCLSVVIEYKATEKVARVCELVIQSDDPNDPVKSVELVAYTIWDCCECGKDCCHEEQHHKDCCCKEHRRECCDDDDEDKDDKLEPRYGAAHRNQAFSGP